MFGKALSGLAGGCYGEGSTVLKFPVVFCGTSPGSSVWNDCSRELQLWHHWHPVVLQLSRHRCPGTAVSETSPESHGSLSHVPSSQCCAALLRSLTLSH